MERQEWRGAPPIDLRKQEVREWAEERGPEDEPTNVEELPAAEPEPTSEADALEELRQDEDFAHAERYHEGLEHFRGDLQHIVETGSLGSYDNEGNLSSVVNKDLSKQVAEVMKSRDWDEAAAALYVAAQWRQHALESYSAILDRANDATMRRIIIEKMHAVEKMVVHGADQKRVSSM